MSEPVFSGGGLDMAAEHADDQQPIALRDQRLVRQLESGEVLVYDLRDDQAHCLDPTSASVWGLCNGQRTAEGIAQELDLPVDEATRRALVGAALDELHGASLIEHHQPASGGIDRRELLRRVGSTAAAAALVPAVLSIIAPTPAAASTCIQSGGACTSNLQCCSGFCRPGGTCA